MKETLLFSLLTVLLISTGIFPFYGNQTVYAAGLPAFPGAEGFGAISQGGRGGQVIEVTNLEDSARGESVVPGSLRACAEASGPRTCVFRVGGIINLKGRFEITNPYITIAGQTAPGGGIVLSGTPGLSDNGITVRTHDVVIRYIRVRLHGIGEKKRGQVPFGAINGAYNVIFDHCSSSWTKDKNLIGLDLDLGQAPDLTNVTMQRCLHAEALADHPTSLLIWGSSNYNVDPPIEEYLRVYDISVHHNLFVHNSHRNPRTESAGTEVINNVVFNWFSRVGESVAKNTVDYVNNYWKPGPGSGSLILKHEYGEALPPYNLFPDPSIYISGNIVEGIDPATDNWEFIKKDFLSRNDPEGGKLLPESQRRFTRLTQGPFPVTVQTASQAYDVVLADVGANAKLDCKGNWISNADSVDKRIIADVVNGTGWSSPPTEAGAFPAIASGSPCVDTDSDGMADEWETLKFGTLSYGSASDFSSDFDSDGYTDLEEFLNGTDPTGGTDPSPSPFPPPDGSPTPEPTPDGKPSPDNRTRPEDGNDQEMQSFPTEFVIAFIVFIGAVGAVILLRRR